MKLEDLQYSKNKIIVPVVVVAVLIVATLFFFVPYVTQNNTIDTVVRNTKNAVDQIKLTRAYYVDSVVGDIKKLAPNIKFHYNHWGKDNGLIPLPTTTIHDLSKIFSENTGLKFKLYSEFPFLNRKDRVLTKQEKDALKYTKQNPDGIYVQEDTVDGKPVLRVAVTDFMTSPACVTCHNSHKERTWEEGKWKLGDKRGVLEVITPLDEDLVANERVRNYILAFITVAMVLLLAYYIYVLMGREKQWSDLNSMLDKAVKEKTKEIMEQKDKAEAANKAKSEFLTNISHEVRTPLNAIIGFSSILKEEEVNEEKLDYLDTMEHSANQLVNIINDILSLSDMEKGKLSIKKEEFNTVDLENVCQSHKFVAQEKKISFDIESSNLDQLVFGSKVRIEQIMNNLLSNAVKFTPDGGEIKVSLKMEKEKFKFSVKDSGPGISKEKLNTIFDSFSQEDGSTTRSYGGVGIGLSIVKHLVDLLNGKVNVKSKNGEGSKFWFEIPLEVLETNQNKTTINDDTQDETKAKEEFDIKSLNIKALLVDDNAINLVLIKKILENLGLNCDLAKDGVEGVEKFKNGNFDIVFMDENMPNMNGIEATKQILEYEKQNNLKHTPVVAVTANAMAGDREKFLAAGMDEYISKPATKDDFIKALVKFFNK